jgi:hypothetical protein
MLKAGPVVDSMRRLAYTAFGVGSPVPGATTVQPYSKSNAVFAPYPVTKLLTQPKISSDYTGSNVASFDMESIAHGCFVALQQGAVAPALSCTIRYIGTKAGSGKKVIVDKEFKITKPGLYGLSTGPETLQKVIFKDEDDLKGLVSLEPSILKPTILVVKGVVAQMGFDEIAYTAHVRDDA